MSYVSKVTDTSGNTGLVGSSLYGTCTTAAGTAAKVAVIEGFDTLIEGVTVHIKFANSNTADTPTLSIKSSSSATSGTTAKNIYKYGTTKPGTTGDTSWQAGSVVSFTYDGSYWQMNDHIDNTQAVTSVNNKTGAVTLTAADVGASTTDANVTQTETSTNADYEVLFSGTSSSGVTSTEGARKNFHCTYNPSTSTLAVSSSTSAARLDYGKFTLSNSSANSIKLDLATATFGATISHSGVGITYGNTDAVTTNGNTWDGTNTSLKSAITAIYNYIDDQITDALNTAY